MFARPLAALVLFGLGLGPLAGCAQKGTVTFSIEAPRDAHMSPFADPRRDELALVDELSGMPLGSPVSTDAPSGSSLAIGDLPVGHYSVRLSVSGGAQLLGLGRAPDLDINPGEDQSFTLHVRKPLAFYGAASVLGDGSLLALPGPLMVLDTTLPAQPSLMPIAAVSGQASATVVTVDGLYVLAGVPGKLLAVSTFDPSMVQSVTLATAAGQSGAPKPRQVVRSSDGKWYAVVTDQGVSAGDLSSLLGGSAAPLPTQKLANARKAVFDGAGSTLTVLTGPDWEALVCGTPTSCSTVAYTVDGSGALSSSPTTARAPHNATGLVYDNTQTLVFATPCALGAVHPDGSPALDGAQIFDVVSSGDRLIGVMGTFIEQKVAIDPDDPSVRNANISFGQIAITDESGRSVTPFSLPPDRISLSMPSPDGSVVQARLAPGGLTAYESVLSPDGSHLVFANRLRYQATNLHYFEIDQDDTPLAYCVLNVVEDIYRLSEVDLSSGSVGYAAATALHDVNCTTQCFECSLGCTPTADPDDCSNTDGYKPAGLSVIWGGL